MVERGLTLTIAAADQEFVKAAQRRQFPRCRALGVILSVEIVEEFANGEGIALDVAIVGALPRGGLSLAAAADFTAQELGELNQVGPIALDRVVAEVFLELEIVEKLANQWGEVFYLDHCAVGRSSGYGQFVRGVHKTGRVGEDSGTKYLPPPAFIGGPLVRRSPSHCETKPSHGFGRPP